MRFLIPLLMLIPLIAHAGWWSSFCERHLAAEDPYPYAEHDFETLLGEYFRTHNGRMLDEIVYRVRYGGITEAERRLFWERFR